jgi:hypothetical protein
VSEKRFINAIENWLICLEMFIIAICFSLVFPVEEITAMTVTEGPGNTAGNTDSAGGAVEKDLKDARAPTPPYGTFAPETTSKDV